ncbi:SulP family inorganic anion transporter [Nitrincola nitratireducens]|uniref:Putative sulfate transporterc/MT1781 n=1 Tax=Nitrincola nitratireducens TaxID=1229521 RepID=W9V1A9_9GAMM|nr:sulfate permease [Nitrincola nitratireducens]EXJ10746.1 putative sulfate transporterc/MT1781 [Nitrincola nitratireducens]
MNLKRFFPITEWLPQYRLDTLNQDILAAVIVTIMLIPQSLAYAMLAGLPPEVGLYASIAPLILYAVFGSSRTLAVGPVAVISLMTAVAAGQLAQQGTPEYIGAVLILTLLSGLMLTLMGLLRLGFLANFLSHPVISGFITASGIIIAASQLKHLFGVQISGHHLPEILMSLIHEIQHTNTPTLLLGLGSLLFLYATRVGLQSLLVKIGLSDYLAGMLSKTAPILAVVITTGITFHYRLDLQGVAVVGQIPSGLPSLSLPSIDLEMWQSLWMGALLISLVGFVESVSVGQTLAAKRRQRIDPDQELIGLGASNLGAAISSGMPVTGGFSRSVVNFDAGAQTPAAGAFTALGIIFATLWLTPLIAYLPLATLAATIIVAVLSLVDFKAIFHTYHYSGSDFSAMLATILVTLGAGVEAGIIVGVLLSILIHLYRTSRPHSAIIGRVTGTEHFRNIDRHSVETNPDIAILRVDESLYFANARYLEDRVAALVKHQSELKHLVLACQAINYIDASALESLETINERLKEADICLHFAEIKGPVMDRLNNVNFFDHISGRVFLSTFDAWKYLTP